MVAGRARRRAWQLRQLRVPEAWRVTRGRGAVVAVVDQGIDCTHPEFSSRVVGARERDEPSRAAIAREAHGTKVAGLALAGGDEVIGVAPEALLLPAPAESLVYRVGGVEEADAIRMAVRSGADVICCAWGPARDDLGRITVPAHTRAAIEEAVARGRAGRGAVVVFAAGNERAQLAGNPYACLESVIAVGACTARERRLQCSNWGDALWCVAPSGDPGNPNRTHDEIATTAPTGSLRLGATWYVDDFGSTSAACAQVAGLCALVLSANRDLHWWEVKEIVKQSCVKIGGTDATYDRRGHSRYFGYGRPDARRAVELAGRAATRGSRAGVETQCGVR